MGVWEYIKRHDYELLALAVALAGLTRGAALMVPWPGPMGAALANYGAVLPGPAWGLILALASAGLLLFLAVGGVRLGAVAAFSAMLLWFWQAYEAILGGTPPTAVVLVVLALSSLVVYVKIRRGNGLGDT